VQELKETLRFVGVISLLVLPLFAYTWIRGEPLHVLHYTDERLHYGLVHEYATGHFVVDGKAYSSATTPLFHLTLAPFDAVGVSRFVLRALNLSLVPIFAAVAFSDLVRATDRRTAWLVTLAIVLSPYMAARGFVLLTENYSYLWFWLAARPWLFPRRGGGGPRGGGGAWGGGIAAARLGFESLVQREVAPAARGTAITRAETTFQLAWVAGAVVPVAFPLPTTPALLAAAAVCLLAATTYTTGLLRLGRRRVPSR
jgi:hypothetical protein